MRGSLEKTRGRSPLGELRERLPPASCAWAAVPSVMPCVCKTVQADFIGIWMGSLGPGLWCKARVLGSMEEVSHKQVAGCWGWRLQSDCSRV